MTSPLLIGAINQPGALGLSTEDVSLASDQRIALTLDNTVYDSQGRICARKGWTGLTTTGGHSDDTDAIFEYVESSTSKRIISAANGKIYEGTTTLTNRTGVLTPADDDWLFLNFNGKCVGVQAGETPIVKTGAGNFADISAASGSLPTGNAGLSAFGRLWITDNNEKSIKICASLDETHWSTGAVTLDTTLVWPDGLDKVVALAEWQDRLVIFGERSTLIYVNPEDPSDAAFVLSDVINVGCVARNSVASVANDLVFLAVDGLHSLERAIQFSNVPQEAIGRAVRTELASDIAQVIATPGVIHASYSRLQGFYLCRIGSKYWSFDMRTGDARASKWTGIGFKSIHAATNGTLYFGQNGEVAEYSGYLDDASTYQFRYASAYLDLAEGREIYPKTLLATVISTGDYVITALMRYDYLQDSETSQFTMATARTVSEWQPANVATTSAHEWGTAEWSGGSTSTISAPFDLSGAGSRVQIGINTTINGHSFCIQRLAMTSRLGRIAA